VNTKLENIQDWAELARLSNWSTSEMARQCGVTVRSLHRYFHKNKGASTKTWLAQQRQRYAYELLSKGCSIKETAFFLGYKHPTNFTRKFKNHWGVCPSQRTAAINCS
jgi:AraC-like DNA-binding protein